MKVKILGTRGEIEPFFPKHKKQSGISIDEKILLDLGEKEYLDLNPKGVFITHLHPDHAYFVRWGKEETPPINVPIFVPEMLLIAPQENVKILNEPIEFQGYQITPIPTHHSIKVKSQAYLVKKGRKSLLYTADLIWIDKEYHSLFDLVDLVITDGSYLRKGGMVRKDKEGKLFGHQGVPNLIDLFKPYTKKIVITHFGGWFFKDKKGKSALEKLGKEKGVELVVAEDGFEIDV